ncbi:MAG: hypothetical protein ACXWD8_02475 [Mycobacterium sp.]
MTEPTTSSSEPATGPVASTPPPPPVTTYQAEPPRRARVAVAAAWVGIVAGVVFTVAVIFFSGFILGAHSGGHRGGPGAHKGDEGFAGIHRGPPPMFPMGPRGEFEGPGPGSGPFGPGGPRFEPTQPGSPGSPGSTTTPSRP